MAQEYMMQAIKSKCERKPNLYDCTFTPPDEHGLWGARSSHFPWIGNGTTPKDAFKMMKHDIGYIIRKKPYLMQAIESGELKRYTALI